MLRKTRFRHASTDRTAPGAKGWLALLSLVAFFGTCGLTAREAQAQQAAAAHKLQAIDVQNLPGKQVQVRLRMDGPAPEPLSFTIDRPARIALDLPDTAIALESRRTDVKAGGVDTIQAAEAGGRTRLVVNLDTMMTYTTRVEGNDILLTIGGTQQAAAAAPAAARPKSTAAAAGPRSIRKIDFRRGPDGAGRIVVDLTDPRTPVNLRQQGTQILVDFTGADLPKDLMRRYDVLDFGTLVQTIDARRVNEGAQLAIVATGDYEQLAYQTDNQYIVEVKPVVRLAAAAEEKKVYKGERLSLVFQDIEVRAVLQLLADTSGENIVVSDTVRGNITLRLQNVPWDQALDIVLRTKGLDKRRHDNVIIVAPTEELAQQEAIEMKARKDAQQLAPLRTEFVQVNYAKAASLAALLKSGGEKSLMSDRGSVTIDDRTNTLLVQDTAEKLQEIRQLVATLDIPVRQVLIESRIVVVSDDFTRSLGARTGFTQVEQKGSDGLLAVSGSAATSNTIVDSALENLQNTGSPFPVGLPSGATNTDRYNVNLPSANSAGKIALAFLDSNVLLDLELSAAQSEGRGEIISAPRVITANQKEAVIEQGVEIPYQQAASSGATTIEFKKAVLSLKVTPQITPDNRIIMDLTISKDSVGGVLVTSGGANVPSIDTREITTQVRVNDGETVVLGGIMETEQRHNETKVPWLGDIPGLGYLFKNKIRVDNKDELLIFVTPRILREGASLH